MNTFTEGGFTAFIAIDWSDKKHDFCLQAAGSREREFGTFLHDVRLIDEWAHALHQRFGGSIAVALELSKGPVVYALQKYDFFVLFPINPSTLAKYREAFKPSGAKDDRAGPEKPDGRLSGISASPWAKMPASRGAESEEEIPSYPLTGVQSEGGAGRRPRREDAGRIGQAA